MQSESDGTRPLGSDSVEQEMAHDEPHPGCNCGRRRATKTASPLLTDDLVIAARDRPREPELPAETEARALSTPITPKLARYDVIILSGEPAPGDRETRMAAEFARHEHRVFHLGAHNTSKQPPAAPTLERIQAPPATLANADHLLPTLSNLRRAKAIEAAVVITSSNLSPDAAREMRYRWGWRIAAESGAPEDLLHYAGVRIAFDVQPTAQDEKGSVALPAGLSWPSRWAALDKAFRAAWPKASVIVLTHDNLAFNRMCLASILENTEYPNYELLVIDNASTDGTVEELQRLARKVPNLTVILNDHNAGFGPGNNQGLEASTGDILILLNNDTMVPRGWITRLARHLDNPAVGLIGPATNRTCNEAQLDYPYQTYREYKAIARALGERHDGERYPIRMPMMFCTAFRRDTYENIGPLDVRYEVGMFEDEDYAIRARQAGYVVAWTPEVYVHHAYHASIGKLVPSGEYMRLVRLNQGRFEEKWGICWERHRPPPNPAA